MEEFALAFVYLRQAPAWWAWGLGAPPRARRVFDALRDGILAGTPFPFCEAPHQVALIQGSTGADFIVVLAQIGRATDDGASVRGAVSAWFEQCNVEKCDAYKWITPPCTVVGNVRGTLRFLGPLFGTTEDRLYVRDSLGSIGLK